MSVLNYSSKLVVLTHSEKVSLCRARIALLSFVLEVIERDYPARQGLVNMAAFLRKTDLKANTEELHFDVFLLTSGVLRIETAAISCLIASLLSTPSIAIWVGTANFNSSLSEFLSVGAFHEMDSLV